MKIIIISGLPGSGKSTAAEGIAAKLKLPVFSVDPIESAILKTGLKRSFETGLAAYIVAETLAAEQLKLGSSVIIDAVNPVPQARQAWRDLAKKYNANLVIIECSLDEELHRSRLQTRVRNLHGIAEVTWDDVEKLRKEYTVWEDKKLVVNTAKSKDEILEEITGYINSVSSL